MVQEQCDEQTPKPPVSIQKGVNGLELDMGERGAEQNRQPACFAIEKPLQLAHTRLHLLRWRGHKACVARAGSSDPILAAAEFAGLLGAAAALSHQGGVHLS